MHQKVSLWAKNYGTFIFSRMQRNHNNWPEAIISCFALKKNFFFFSFFFWMMVTGVTRKNLWGKICRGWWCGTVGTWRDRRLCHEIVYNFLMLPIFPELYQNHFEHYRNKSSSLIPLLLPTATKCTHPWMAERGTVV